VEGSTAINSGNEMTKTHVQETAYHRH